MSDQYPRVRRFYKRITKGSKRQTPRYLDDLWSFFLHCWHLRDWIKEDKTVPVAIRKRVEKDVHKRRYIRICGDLANRSKHLVLRRGKHGKRGKRPTVRGAKIVRQILVGIAEDIHSDDSESSIAYVDTVIRVSGSTIGATALATKAMEQWDQLLKSWRRK